MSRIAPSSSLRRFQQYIARTVPGLTITKTIQIIQFLCCMNLSPGLFIALRGKHVLQRAAFYKLARKPYTRPEYRHNNQSDSDSRSE